MTEEDQHEEIVIVSQRLGARVSEITRNKEEVDEVARLLSDHKVNSGTSDYSVELDGHRVEIKAWSESITGEMEELVSCDGLKGAAITDIPDGIGDDARYQLTGKLNVDDKLDTDIMKVVKQQTEE